jgi:hypothetical protein
MRAPPFGLSGLWLLYEFFVDGCRCSICGMCMAWVVLWTVVGTCSLAAWDEPSVGGSFSSLFFGGITWVFFRTHKQWVPMLGLDGREAIEHQ